MLLTLTVAYDGTRFRGWARQPGERTIEGVLADALASVFSSAGPLAVAGRTDAGVHALANVVSVEVDGGPPAGRALRALNAVLPSDLTVIAAAQAPSSFHARYSARSRSYRYRVLRCATRSPFEVGRSLWHPAPIDQARLAASAALLPGEHDFRAFTPTDTEHGLFRRSVVSARWHDRGDVLEFEITADSFLRHMVRTLVGTMLEQRPEQIEALLDGAHRSAAGSTAQPWGLYLVSVGYNGGPDGDAAASGPGRVGADGEG
jgi:tRNA pseudouridine38-40 synthase